MNDEAIGLAIITGLAGLALGTVVGACLVVILT